MRTETVRIKRPKLLIVADPRNPRALALKRKLKHLASPRPNLIAVFGGDGTMLHAIRRHWRRGLPFIGVNLGHRGFLLNNVVEGVGERYFTKRLILRRSPLLEVEVRLANGARRMAYAFNDAHVAADAGKAAWFEVLVDNAVRIPHLVGDGVLVSTAAGSTAYARSMGANPVPVGTEILIVVGSNVAEPLYWRNGANLPLDAEVTFRTKDETRWRKIYGFADSLPLGEVTEMIVRSSKKAVTLLFRPDHDLRKKLADLQFPSFR